MPMYFGAAADCLRYTVKKKKIEHVQKCAWKNHTYQRRTMNSLTDHLPRKNCAGTLLSAFSVALLATGCHFLKLRCYSNKKTKQN